MDYIIPMSPTPDAPLHLGHMAGPYLSADILARTYRFLGKPCHFVSALDSFENWCEHIPSSALETTYRQHQEAFTLLSIKFDDFLDPTQGGFHPAYTQTLRDTFLKFKGYAGYLEKEEQVEFDPKSNTWGFGVQVSGDCPNCGKPVRGNACINCYFYLQPHELINSVLAQNKEKNTLIKNAFMQIDQSCAAQLESIGVAPSAITLLNQWLDKTQGQIRLTYQGKYGIFTEEESPRIIRNTFLQMCCALVGYLAPDTPQKNNLHLFMGFDNFIPCGAGSVALAEKFSDQQIQRIELNHMLHYEGTKFSKSKKHGPKVVNALQGKSDTYKSAMRLFLMRQDLAYSNVNYKAEQFQQFLEYYTGLLCDLFALQNVNPANSQNSKSAWHQKLEVLITRPLNRATLINLFLQSIEQYLSTPNAETLREFTDACQVFDPCLFRRFTMQPEAL